MDVFGSDDFFIHHFRHQVGHAQEYLGGFDVTLLRSQRWPSYVESATVDGVQSTPLSEDAWGTTFFGTDGPMMGKSFG